MPKPGDRISPSQVYGPHHWSTSQLARQFSRTQWELSLHVTAQLDGWHVYARVWRMGEDGRLQHIEVASAAWNGRPAGSREVVEWGQRALAAWLADNLPET